MSSAWASATVRKISSVVESVTWILLSDDGCTHSPPMKKRSAWRRDAAAGLAMVILGPLSVHAASGTRR
jgi:hypothetical protein